MKEDQKIVIYQTEDGQTQIDVRLENETVWLTQAQMAQLFKSSRTNVLEHIQHIYEVEELEKEATCRNFRQVRQEGKRMVNRTIHLRQPLPRGVALVHRPRAVSQETIDTQKKVPPLPFTGRRRFLPCRRPEAEREDDLFLKELEGVKGVKVVKGVKEPPVPPPIGGGQGEA